MLTGCAKGSLLVHFREYVKRVHGEEDYRALASALSPASRATFTGLITHGGWNPVSVWNETLGTFLPRHYLEPDEGMRRVARFIANEDLNSVYKMVLKLGSAGLFIKRLNSLWSRYFNTCRLLPEEIGPNRYRLLLLGPLGPEEAPDHFTCGPGISAWVAHGLHLMGVSAVMEKTQCRQKAGKHCEYIISW